MRIVGKAGDKYLCTFSMDEMMAFFPKTCQPPVDALKEGEEYSIMDWANRVYQAELHIQMFQLNLGTVRHCTDELQKVWEECFATK